MNSIESKYSLLSESEKKQIVEAIDLMLSKKEIGKTKKASSYRKNLLKVSVWSEEDIKDLENNIKTFGKWQAEKW